MEESLTFLYTANLGGDLDLLPRLYTFIKGLRSRVESGRTIYVDIGGACRPDVWHCDVTEGRSMLVALDGMGCAVANVSGYAAAGEARSRLGENVALALVDEENPFTSDELVFTVTPPRWIEWDRLVIWIAPNDNTYLENRVLSFMRLQAGQVGVVSLERVERIWGLTAASVHTMPANTSPDPTIAGAIEFIQAEARYAQKRREGR